MRGVLLQSFEAHLQQAELPLDHAKRVLDLCSHACLDVLALLRLRLRTALRQLGNVARSRCDVPVHLALYAALRAAISRVGPHMFFLAMQQIGYLFYIGLVGRRRRDGVDQTAVGVHANVRLHPEEPLVALLRLVHLRIALALLVLGRTGRRDDRRVNDAAALEQQSLAGEVRVDLLEDVFRQVVLFQEMPEELMPSTEVNQLESQEAPA